MAELSKEQLLLIESACSRLVHDFADLVDRREYARLAQLFTVDASFARPRSPDTIIVGRDNIHNAFAMRPIDDITRHLVHNVRITPTSAEAANGSFYLVLYTARSNPQTSDFGATADSRRLIADIVDQYVLTEEGWRIFSRRGRIVMHTT